MAWDWERIEHEWLHEIFEAAPHPWKEGLILLWLRHAERGCRHGYRYWTPRTAAPQIVADAKAGKMPGRRALASITGISEERARVMLASHFEWMDPASISDDVRAKIEPRPAGNRRSAPPASAPGSTYVGPGFSPGSTYVPPASAPGTEHKTEVVPSSDARVSPTSAPRSIDVPPASAPRTPNVGPDRARDLRAERSRDEDEYDHGSLSDTAPAAPRETPAPAPTPAPRAPRGLARRSASGGWAPAASAASEAVGGLAPSTAPPPGAAGPPPDPLAQVWAHAAQYGPLPPWARNLLPGALRDHEPAALCRVLDWARRAPDPDAAAIRHAIESGARGSLGPAYVLDACWLADRLVRAEVWDREGRPEAEGAHVPEAELLARRQAAEAEARAEDLARWPDWEPPPGWTGLWRLYAGLCVEAERARALLEVGGDGEVAGASWLRGLRDRGWREDWPAPQAAIVAAKDQDLGPSGRGSQHAV